MKRTWLDVIVEIFPSIASTLGPIGLGVCLIITTLGAILLIADRRGWMRPKVDAPTFTCKGGNSECLTLLTAIHGASEAGHRTTHDQLKRLLSEAPEGCPLEKK